MQGKKTLCFLLLVGVVSMGILFTTYGYEETWQLWNIPVMMPHFADLRSITGGAESYALGHDPLYHNPQDPWQRPMNYPRIWQSLFALGIDQADTTWLGILFIILFVVGLFLFVGKINNKTGFLLALSLFSPAVLLAVERANNDLVIFFVLSVALATIQMAPIVSIMLFNVAIMLKLFPIFALLYLLQEDKWSAIKGLVLSGAITLAYLCFTYGDLYPIHQATQRAVNISYGVSVLGIYLGNLWQSLYLKYGLVILLYCIALFIALGSLYLAQVEKRHKKVMQKSDRFIAAFRMGAGIYIGTFMLRSSFDYRLIFLLFTLPQLLLWHARVSGLLKRTLLVTIAGIVVSLWSLVIFYPFGMIGILLDEIANWAVYGGLSFWFICSAPHWFRDLLEKLCKPLDIALERLGFRDRYVAEHLL